MQQARQEIFPDLSSRARRFKAAERDCGLALARLARVEQQPGPHDSSNPSSLRVTTPSVSITPRSGMTLTSTSRSTSDQPRPDPQHELELLGVVGGDAKSVGAG